MSRPGDLQSPTLGAQVKLARVYGLTTDEVHNALSWARTAKVAATARAKGELIGHPPAPPARRPDWDYAHVPEPNDGKKYCAQCDQRVAPDFAARCLDSFCKAKSAIAVDESTVRRIVAFDTNQAGA